MRAAAGGRHRGRHAHLRQPRRGACRHRPPGRPRPPAHRLHRRARRAHHHPAPARRAPARAGRGGHRGGRPLDGARAVRPPVGVRGSAGTAAARPLADGARRRERLRRAGGVRRTAGLRAAHPRRRLGHRVRRPAVQHRRRARPDDGTAAPGRGGRPGGPPRHGPRGRARRRNRLGAGGVDGAGVDGGAAGVRRGGGPAGGRTRGPSAG
ncbi:hypothetical protein SGPA1_30272 [Streptomyces misionensis JCM 4497]